MCAGRLVLHTGCRRKRGACGGNKLSIRTHLLPIYYILRGGASSEQKNSFLSPWPRLISSSEAFLGLSFLELSFPELSFLISSAEDEEEDCLSCRYLGALSRDRLPPR